MKHSPGKWEAEFVGHGGPGDNPVEFWEVTNGHARIAENMTEADARLIAAAPELLRALRFILSETSNDVAGLPRSDALALIGNVADIARAAIAKINA